RTAPREPAHPEFGEQRLDRKPGRWRRRLRRRNEAPEADEVQGAARGRTRVRERHEAVAIPGRGSEDQPRIRRKDFRRKLTAGENQIGCWSSRRERLKSVWQRYKESACCNAGTDETFSRRMCAEMFRLSPYCPERPIRTASLRSHHSGLSRIRADAVASPIFSHVPDEIFPRRSCTEISRLSPDFPLRHRASVAGTGDKNGSSSAQPRHAESYCRKRC